MIILIKKYRLWTVVYHSWMKLIGRSYKKMKINLKRLWSILLILGSNKKRIRMRIWGLNRCKIVIRRVFSRKELLRKIVIIVIRMFKTIRNRWSSWIQVRIISLLSQIFIIKYSPNKKLKNKLFNIKKYKINKYHNNSSSLLFYNKNNKILFLLNKPIK